MLKSYSELRKIDVLPYCEIRKEGKEEIPYLNWAKCIDLLYENGAEKVFWEPVQNEHGSSLIEAAHDFKDKYDVSNRVYETRIRVTIDDNTFEYQGPVMNGANPVKDNSMSQQRLYNSQCRLFVKAVAIRTGLGFNLWLKNEEKEREIQERGEFKHDINEVRNRVFEMCTTLNKRGFSKQDIAEHIGISKNDLEINTKMYSKLAEFEGKIQKLLNDTQ